MSFIFQIFILLFTIVIVAFVQQYRKRKKQPPGPLGLPFVGENPLHILQYLFPKMFPIVSQNQYFIDMKNKYGDIWSTDLGDRKLVVMASFDLMNEAFVDNWKYFQGPRTNKLFKMITENHGMVFNAGEIWDSNRQLAIKSLRELGMGKRQFESQINEEVYEMMEDIERGPCEHVLSPKIFIKSISHITHQLLFDIGSEDIGPEFDRFIRDLTVMFHLNEANIIEFIPNKIPLKIIRTIVPQVDDFVKSKESSLKFVEQLCRDRAKVESEFSKPSCVFDYYWRYRYQDNPDVECTDKLTDITQSMFDVFFGSMDTTTILLSFSCLLLGKHRDLQEDLRKELQVQVDDYKLINMEMRKNCPKFLSFIDEVQRTQVVIPRLLRQVVSNCLFKNYEITTDDIIYGDLNAIFKDPSLFENPECFDPYRFLDTSRTKYTPNKYLIPFGLGKRVCLGESLAVMEIFLYLSRIILRYDISLPQETRDNFDNIIEGITYLNHAPLEHELVLKLYHS